MTRPEKTGEEKRDQTIEVRVTSTEKSQLKIIAKEDGKTVSDFVRVLVLNAKPSRNVPTPDREILLRLNAALNMIGSNLNQIAKTRNIKYKAGELPGAVDDELMNTLYGVRTLSKHLMELLEYGA